MYPINQQIMLSSKNNEQGISRICVYTWAAVTQSFHLTSTVSVKLYRGLAQDAINTKIKPFKEKD